MKVLVLSHLYPPHAVGGYELACADVVRHWRDRGHDVTVLASNDRFPDVSDTDPPWVHRRLTTFHGGLPGAARRRGRAAREWALARDHTIVTRLLRSVRPDVVSIWHPGGVAISIINRLLDAPVPTVLVANDRWPIYKKASDPTWHRRVGLFRGPVDLARGTWVCCSGSLRDQLSSAGVLNEVQTPVVPLGVDLDTFPIEARGRGNWTGRILFVGRLVESKGVYTAVRALSLLPNATLRILGHGEPDAVDGLFRLADELGVTDRLDIDAVRRADLPRRYRDADVVVFPSEWDEPFGIVPLEAMACATPVVATGTGGSGEYLVDGDNSLLFQPGDEHALAAAVDQLASDPDLRSRLVAGGTVTARELTTTVLARRLEEIHLAAVG